MKKTFFIILVITSIFGLMSCTKKNQFIDILSESNVMKLQNEINDCYISSKNNGMYCLLKYRINNCIYEHIFLYQHNNYDIKIICEDNQYQDGDYIYYNYDVKCMDYLNNNEIIYKQEIYDDFQHYSIIYSDKENIEIEKSEYLQQYIEEFLNNNGVNQHLNTTMNLVNTKNSIKRYGEKQKKFEDYTYVAIFEFPDEQNLTFKVNNKEIGIANCELMIELSKAMKSNHYSLKTKHLYIVGYEDDIQYEIIVNFIMNQ